MCVQTLNITFRCSTCVWIFVANRKTQVKPVLAMNLLQMMAKTG